MRGLQRDFLLWCMAYNGNCLDLGQNLSRPLQTLPLENRQTTANCPSRKNLPLPSPVKACPARRRDSVCRDSDSHQSPHFLVITTPLRGNVFSDWNEAVPAQRRKLDAQDQQLLPESGRGRTRPNEKAERGERPQEHYRQTSAMTTVVVP